MKRLLIGLVLGLTMIALIAAPAFAGSQPPDPSKSPGIGCQRLDLILGEEVGGFVEFNLRYIDLYPDYQNEIRVNVSIKNLVPPNGVSFLVKLDVDLNYGNSNFADLSTWAVASGKGNAGTSFVVPVVIKGAYELRYHATVTVVAQDGNYVATSGNLTFKALTAY